MQFRECNQPWIEMQLLYSGRYRTCCYYSRELEYDPLDIPAIWRSDYFKHIRRLIASGDPAGSYCDNCEYVKYHEKPHTVIPDTVTGDRRRNWERALEYQAKGVVDIDTFPVKYYMQFGVACNLRCIMCNHPQRYAGGENKELSAESMLRNSEYLKLAESVHIIGGEPLIIPNAVRFLEGVLARPELCDLRYVLYTNALCLDAFIERFLPLHEIDITASIDSSGKYYDAIRVRSSWEQVTGNLERFNEVGRKHGYRWYVYISIVLMKSGLLGLPELISWCIANEFPTTIVNIGDLEGMRNDHEHIFRNPDLLKEIPGWEAALTKCIRLFSDAGRHMEAKRLENALTDLTNAAATNEVKRSRTISFKTPVKWESLFAGSGAQLVAQLHQNLYGRTKSASAIEIGLDGLKFTPTLALDHIVTDFFTPGADDIEGKHWLRLKYRWGNAGVDPNGCVVDLQDEQCRVLEPWQVQTAKTSGTEITAVFNLPPGIPQVRIRLTLPSLESGYLPDEISLERSVPGPSLVEISNLQ